MEEKVANQLKIVLEKESFVDEGDGVVSFPNGLTITDGTKQRNGTTYDIDSLDISKYSNQLTGDHKDELGSLIGETIGVVKEGGRVVVNKIRYAINENPYARLAYNLLIGGFSKNFSTETIGPRPDPETGIYWNAELVGLSQVVTQNNYNAHINKVVHNSLERSKEDGLDVSGIEEKVLNQINKEEQKMEDKNKDVEEVKEEVTTVTGSQTTETEKESTEDKTVETTETVSEEKSNDESKEENAIESTEQSNVEKAENGTWIETTTTTTSREYIESPEEKAERKAREAKWEAQEERRIKAEETPEVVVVVESDNEATEKTENAQEVTENKMESEEDKVEDEVVEDEPKKKKKKGKKKMSKTSNALTAEQVAEIVANAVNPLNEKIEAVQEEAKNAFDKSAEEPKFKDGEVEGDEKATNKYAEMDFDERYNLQVNSAWDAVKLQNIEAQTTLREINQFNLDALKKEGLAKNAIGLEELGNFVIAPEMYKEMQGHRNDYTAILNVTEWKETLSMEFAWLKRVGDIDMQSVGLQATEEDEDANLKPISEYSAVPMKSELEELAAVTVVATSATRFAAVDLLSDAAAGYRNDYDRKRAQLVIARLEQAIDTTGYSTAYNPSEDVDALTTLIDAITDISDTTLNGTLIFNARTFAEIKSRALKAGANGPLAEILTTGELPTLFGYKFVIVPNDLMPSLGGSETISHTVDGEAQLIQHAVFFADLSTFTGRTSGGLQYDVSNSAPYEVGNTVRSAYQRNELVLRGSFFRGGAVKDVEVVSGVRQGNSANVS